jgi:hypothetical protein
MTEDYPLKQRQDWREPSPRSRWILTVAEVTDDTPLDGDDLDVVLVELSLSSIEVDRHGVKT